MTCFSGAGRARSKARVSSSGLSANRASASRGWSRSFAQGSARRRTPGSNGRRRSSCRTRPCTRSPNGAVCASAAPTRPTGTRLADLENTLRLIGLDAAEYAPLLAPLFDIPLPEDRAAKFAPEELRRRQLAAMTALFLAGARSQPVVLAFEDLHWADPTSLDLLRRSPSAARRRRFSSSRRLGRNSARTGACARTTAYFARAA